MKKLIAGILSLSTAACIVDGYNPRYSFNELQVHNLSGAAIENVSVEVVNSPRSLSCDEVAKNAMCDKRWGRRLYPQAGIELSWTHHDGSAQSETLTPPIPAYFISGLPLRIVVEIKEDGSVEPYYEQEEPGDDDLMG